MLEEESNWLGGGSHRASVATEGCVNAVLEEEVMHFVSQGTYSVC